MKWNLFPIDRDVYTWHTRTNIVYFRVSKQVFFQTFSLKFRVPVIHANLVFYCPQLYWYWLKMRIIWLFKNSHLKTIHGLGASFVHEITKKGSSLRSVKKENISIVPYLVKWKFLPEVKNIYEFRVLLMVVRIWYLLYMGWSIWKFPVQKRQ